MVRKQKMDECLCISVLMRPLVFVEPDESEGESNGNGKKKTIKRAV